MDYTELYKKCSKENKTCSHCRFLYSDPMLKNIPVDEAPPLCMNMQNKPVGGWKVIMPWDTCELWEYCKDDKILKQYNCL